MKLYRDLPGYDLESRINKALDRGADWLTGRVENTLMVCAGLSIFLVALIVAAHAWSVK